jgi:hypothetical protein
MLSSTADRDWWVDCFKAPDQVLAKLATLLDQAQPVDSGCWELPQATAARISVNRHPIVTPYRRPILTPFALSWPGAA